MLLLVLLIFLFLVNTNGDKKDRYIGIVSNMLEFTAKGIFSENHVHAAGQFYDDKPRKLGGRKSMVPTDGI